jgi:hypothetical protein
VMLCMVLPPTTSIAPQSFIVPRMAMIGSSMNPFAF